MFSRLNMQVLAIFAVLLVVAQADQLIEKREELAPRQLSNILSDVTNILGGAAVPSSTPSPSSQTSSAAPSSSTLLSTSEEPTPTPTPTPTPSPSSSTPPSSSDVPSTTPPVSTPVTSSPPDTSAPVTTPPPTTITSKTSAKSTPSVSRSESVVIVKQTTTVGGVVMTSESSSTSTAPAPTGTNAEATKDTSTEKSGMSSQTKKTVIGVVVGVVGAIVLGALFFVAWRIWGRKKSEDEGDDLMQDYHGRSAHEKTSDVGAPAASPFQTTLDQYHNPNGRNANVSSNF